MPFLIFAIIFFISGATGLIYESIWSHYLKLVLGHAAYAQALVLSIFMGGMAVGAAIAGRLSHKIKKLILMYAFVEGIIGIFGIVFHELFVNVIDIGYNHIFRLTDSATITTLLKWTLSALLILPQSILLGATFPLLSGGLIRHFPNQPGRVIAVLYFTNSLGASVGVIISGFVLIEYIGLPGTILAAGVMNILLAIVVYFICKWLPDAETLQLETSDKDSHVNTNININDKWLLLVAFGTGLASFIYEIGWIRMLSLVLGASTHSFELMLSAFILGLAIGGLVIRRYIDRLQNPVVILAWVQVLMGFLAMLTIVFYQKTFDVMIYVLSALQKTDQGYTFYNLFSHIISALIMLPPTICAGMTLPLITYICLKITRKEAVIGNVYALNTFGSIIGVVLTIALLMPYLGLKNTIVLGSMVDVFLGLLLFYIAIRQKIILKVRLAWALIVIAMFIMPFFVQWDKVVMSSGVFRTGRILKDEKIVFYQDGRTATVSVAKTERMISIKTNGKPDASISLQKDPTGDESTQLLLAGLPLLHKPDAKNAAVIGMGSGITSNVLLSSPALKEVETIEIEPAMVTGAKYFGKRSERTFSDSRSKIIIEDAKVYIASTKKKYDLIISEPSNPWVSGVASLFTQEFYRFVADKLTPPGLFVQWLHVYENNTALVYSIIKALDPYFKDYHIYAPNAGDLVLIASVNRMMPEIVEPIKISKDFVDELALIGTTKAEDFKIRFVGDKSFFASQIQSNDIAPNSDYFPIVDLNAARARFKGESAHVINNLRNADLPIHEVLIKKSYIHDYEIGHVMKQCCDPSVIRLQNALKIERVLLKGDYDYIDISKDSKIVSLARDFSLQRCEGIDKENIWINSIVDMTYSLTIYFEPKKLHAIWQIPKKSKCFSNLSKSQILLYDLSHSVVMRDYNSMSKISRELLEMKAFKSDKIERFIVFSAVLSASYHKDSKRISELSKDYAKHFNLEMQLLQRKSEKH